MSEQIKYNPIESAKFSKAEISQLNKVTKLGTSENNDRLNGYEILQDLFLVKKIHEKQNVKLEDSVIKFYSTMFSLPVLYRYNKSFMASNYTVNFLEAVKAGKLPFSSYTNFGHNCIERVQPKKNKAPKYILKITKDQLATLDKFVKNGASVSGKIFNDKITEYTKKSGPPEKSDFEKLIEALNTGLRLSKKNNLNQSQRLEAQSIHNLIGANLLPVAKTVTKPKTVKIVAKKAA